ncbi:formylglycine-generating enzyme family protein [Pseudoxanthomonas winnipegensis]|jgi:formylglycine-generating enzyme required for sulfatase activity|uniref:Formylglycine-generating enzyme family protein n=1 Tax=Pseudoxanthomonas winnipegensis TaxID=2480810 RepID=A0ABY1WFP0_9GAMM|nr:formylglycine-generating enzyme family protein [Pseudoxanthomonas winnipegensis]TAA20761.1 formylglycine-generating enzyme family protein [Pseudoxanthomonas winnipegensis]TAH72231.1 formylglycine-generating enzyme family protein [Pseudoxanthomonas winnipegensis]
MTGGTLRRFAPALLALLLTACDRAPEPAARPAAPVASPAPASGQAPARTPSVTISDSNGDAALNWSPPALALEPGQVRQARREAAAALRAGDLFEQPRDAIPLYLALLRLNPNDAIAKRGLANAGTALLAQGRRAVAAAQDDPEALARAVRIAAVVRTVLAQDPRAEPYLEQVDLAEQLARLNATGESQLRQGLLGEEGKDGGLSTFRAVLAQAPGQPRALQGMAATESAFIRRAEDAARAGDFDEAARWMGFANGLREDAQTVKDGYARIEAERTRQIAALRDAGVDDLVSPLGLKDARQKLEAALRIARPGDPVAADLRQRIDLATHYGLFRPGQSFTDAMRGGGRTPVMVVVPHGAFRMGADEDEPGASEAEQPAHYVRFDRGFAVSRTAVTVGQYRRFVQATQYRSRATRRGHSIVYDERSGNFVRRSGVDWQSDYAGAKAADDMPVLHVSVRDAEAYADWLAEQTGHAYRLASEAEFEYILRAGSQGRYSWGNSTPPPAGVGNLTGGNDVSPSGRHWGNAFVGYGDGWWGPAPVATFKPNAWGLYDVGSNISEWVADCWHASFRRAPGDGAAWFNPGCRARVIRGGGWASSPQQARAAWRASQDSDMTSARVGFRVVRGI